MAVDLTIVDLRSASLALTHILPISSVNVVVLFFVSFLLNISD